MALPLLLGELLEGEQMNLASLLKHPGYPALEKLLMASCRRATEDLVRLNPSTEGYEKKLVYLQWKAQERNEHTMEILRSISYHAEVHDVRETEAKQTKPPENIRFKIGGAKE
jgi:hypothetical protein